SAAVCVSGGQQTAAVRRECKGVRPCLEIFQDLPFFPRGGVPDSNRAIPTRRGKESTVGRPGKRHEGFSMSLERPPGVTRFAVPLPDRPVPPTRKYVAAVRRIHDRADAASVTLQCP